MNIIFGVTAPKLSVQLKDTTLSSKEIQVYDKGAESANLLYLCGILSHAEWEEACRRIKKNLEHKLKSKE